jgi:hypothetical protein
VKRTVLDLLLIMLGNQYINKEVQRSKNWSLQNIMFYFAP